MKVVLLQMSVCFRDRFGIILIIAANHLNNRDNGCQPLPNTQTPSHITNSMNDWEWNKHNDFVVAKYVAAHSSPTDQQLDDIICVHVNGRGRFLLLFVFYRVKSGSFAQVIRMLNLMRIDQFFILIWDFWVTNFAKKLTIDVSWFVIFTFGTQTLAITRKTFHPSNLGMPMKFNKCEW